MKFFTSLVTTKRGHLSAGRILLWITFGFLCWYWFHQYNVPDSLVSICQTVMAYELFKKGRDVFETKKSESEIDPTKVG